MAEPYAVGVLMVEKKIKIRDAMQIAKESPIEELVEIVTRNKEDRVKKLAKEFNMTEEADALSKELYKLLPIDLALLKDYFAGKAEIVYKDELVAMEGLTEWMSRMGAKVCKMLEKIIDDDGGSSTNKIAAAKEILSRLAPPKQEIVFENKNAGLSDFMLLNGIDKHLKSIDKSMVKIGVKQ